MTKEHIKEALSARSIEALANYMGFTSKSIRKDYGIDMTIRGIAKRMESKPSIPILIRMLPRIKDKNDKQLTPMYTIIQIPMFINFVKSDGLSFL